MLVCYFPMHHKFVTVLFQSATTFTSINGLHVVRVCFMPKQMPAMGLSQMVIYNSSNFFKFCPFF